MKKIKKEFREVAQLIQMKKKDEKILIFKEVLFLSLLIIMNAINSCILVPSQINNLNRYTNLH